MSRSNHGNQMPMQGARVPLNDSSKQFINTTQHQVQQQAQARNSQQKKQFNEPSRVVQQNSTNTSHENKRRSNRMTGAELREWQQTWRSIMKTTVVYFENDDTPVKEKEKAVLSLKSLGAKVESFFGENVTIIVTKRVFHENTIYARGDPFRHAASKGIKVWNYEKVFRFVDNVGEPIPEVSQPQENQLSNLLRNEKIFGTTDRDPTVRRDDIKYFTGFYVYIYDLSQKMRPVAVREWMQKTDYPKLTKSTNGKSLFLEDSKTSSSNLASLYKRHTKRLKYLQEAEFYREALIDHSYFENSKMRKPSYDERVQYKKKWQAAYFSKFPNENPIIKYKYLSPAQEEIDDLGVSVENNDPGEIDIDEQRVNKKQKLTKLDLKNVSVASAEKLKRKTLGSFNKENNEDYQNSVDLNCIEPNDPNFKVKSLKHGNTIKFDLPAPLRREDSIVGDKFKDEYGEIQASGVVQNQSGSAVINNVAGNNNGNGLGPTQSLIVSKKLRKDQKKMISILPLSKHKSIDTDKTPIKKKQVMVSPKLSPRPLKDTEKSEILNAKNLDSVPKFQICEFAKENKIPENNLKNFGDKLDQGAALILQEDRSDKLHTVEPLDVRTGKVHSMSLQLEDNPVEISCDNKVEISNDKQINNDRDDNDDFHQNRTMNDEKLKREQEKRRKKKKIEEVPIKKSKNDQKPGYCENCRIKYVDFEEHIKMDKHRQFAQAESNFQHIDMLIKEVQMDRLCE